MIKTQSKWKINMKKFLKNLSFEVNLVCSCSCIKFTKIIITFRLCRKVIDKWCEKQCCNPVWSRIITNYVCTWVFCYFIFFNCTCLDIFERSEHIWNSNAIFYYVLSGHRRTNNMAKFHWICIGLIILWDSSSLVRNTNEYHVVQLLK